jgi:hypothetical protein
MSEVAVSAMADDLIPLSVLQLDLDPGEPWPMFLGRRGIAFKPDRIGRDAVTAGDAQRLLAERREAELKARKRQAVLEQEMVEADELRRSQIWKGMSADLMPPGVAPAAAMLQNDKDSQPRRQTPLEEAFSGSGMTYHSWPQEDEAS